MKQIGKHLFTSVCMVKNQFFYINDIEDFRRMSSSVYRLSKIRQRPDFYQEQLSSSDLEGWSVALTAWSTVLRVFEGQYVNNDRKDHTFFMTAVF